jgi:preprotein translocase subunit SecG
MLFAEFWGWVMPFWNFLVLILSVFLILLVLIQRGKGGGLSGAFGGAGGSSAFGSRAGDAFTRITIGVAGVWILLIMAQVVIAQKAAHEGDAPGGSAPSVFGSGEK